MRLPSPLEKLLWLLVGFIFCGASTALAQDELKK